MWQQEAGRVFYRGMDGWVTQVQPKRVPWSQNWSFCQFSSKSVSLVDHHHPLNTYTHPYPPPFHHIIRIQSLSSPPQRPLHRRIASHSSPILRPSWSTTYARIFSPFHRQSHLASNATLILPPFSSPLSSNGKPYLPTHLARVTFLPGPKPPPHPVTLPTLPIPPATGTNRVVVGSAPCSLRLSLNLKFIPPTHTQSIFRIHPPKPTVSITHLCLPINVNTSFSALDHACSQSTHVRDFGESVLPTQQPLNVAYLRHRCV